MYNLGTEEKTVKSTPFPILSPLSPINNKEKERERRRIEEDIYIKKIVC